MCAFCQHVFGLHAALSGGANLLVCGAGLAGEVTTASANLLVPRESARTPMPKSRMRKSGY